MLVQLAGYTAAVPSVVPPPCGETLALVMLPRAPRPYVVVGAMSPNSRTLRRFPSIESYWIVRYALFSSFTLATPYMPVFTSNVVPSGFVRCVCPDIGYV